MQQWTVNLLFKWHLARSTFHSFVMHFRLNFKIEYLNQDSEPVQQIFPNLCRKFSKSVQYKICKHNKFYDCMLRKCLSKNTIFRKNRITGKVILKMHLIWLERKQKICNYKILKVWKPNKYLGGKINERSIFKTKLPGFI